MAASTSREPSRSVTGAAAIATVGASGLTAASLSGRRRLLVLGLGLRAHLGEVAPHARRAVRLAPLEQELLVLLERPAVRGLGPDLADERHLLDRRDVLVDVERAEIRAA